MDIFSQKQKTVSAILKSIVFICAATGTVLSAYAGRHSFMGGKQVFMYFTIQSNLALALICAIGLALLFRKKHVSAPWWVIKFTGTVSITLTGMVFCFVLAPTLGSSAWNTQNILTHAVVPLAAIADFFVVGTCSDIKKRNILWVIVPPILYVVYAAIGYVNDWQFSQGRNYPYFFLNWGSPAGAFGFTDKLPFMGCAWWITALFVFLMAVGYFYLRIVDFLKDKARTKV